MLFYGRDLAVHRRAETRSGKEQFFPACGRAREAKYREKRSFLAECAALRCTRSVPMAASRVTYMYGAQLLTHGQAWREAQADLHFR